MDRAEEAQAEIPDALVAEDRARRARILGEPAGQMAVDRRAEHREVLRLAAKDLRLRVVRGQSLALGCLGLERGLGLLGDRGERLRIGHGDVGERLAVELDARLVDAGDELVVREPVLRARPR